MEHAVFSPTSDDLSLLNSAQRRAVETIDGPVLVLAGAGTGKTRVLTTRLAHILKSGRAFPGQILAVTFTNKAAQEMKNRVSAQMDGAALEGWWLGTFHSLSARILRRHADLVGLTSSFTILDQDDQIRLIKQLMEDDKIDVKKWPPKMVADKIGSWKDKGLKPSDISQDQCGDLCDGKLKILYQKYQDRLRSLNATDFGDLFLHTIEILKNPNNAPILEEYHRKFRYILVDEYQDTNVAQYLWLRLLSRGSGNICCVGDDDQSIYGWRGAEVDNILRFERDFPNAVVVRLEENYRSTGHILSAANAVISHNQDRLGKELFTSIGMGEKIRVKGLWDGEAEARWVSEEIESLQHKKHKLDDMAVLVRAGFQTREFEERFIQLGIPYRVIGGPRFYERMEIRDALAYFRVINQDSDDLAFERIINTPKRGIGDSTIQILYTHARAKGISLYKSVSDLIQGDDLKPKIRGTLTRLMDDFGRWKSLVSTTDHAALAGIVLDESGYVDMWKSEKSPDAAGRVENLKELVSGMEEFESLAQFLEHVSLVMENQDKNTGDQVSIMTLHGAKGLEFKTVFLPGWEEGLFPSQRSMDENGLKGLEEERRLAYVGITRARERCYISFVGNRRMYGNWVNAIPSRFVDELPDDHIEKENDMFQGSVQGRSQHWDSSGFNASYQRQRNIVSSNAQDLENRKNEHGFQRGDKVFHEKFGDGTIIHMDGQKLDIQFKSGGMKRVMDSFVTKAS